MKTFWFIGMILCFFAGYVFDDASIEWLGWPVVAGKYDGIDQGFYGNDPPPKLWTESGIEIGLRKDGVVVWRKIESNNPIQPTPKAGG